MMAMPAEPAEALARAPEHPRGDAEDDYARGDQQPSLEVRGQDLAPERQADHGHDPDDERVREGGADAEQDCLSDGAADRHDVGGHHGLGMAGFQPVQGTEQDGEGKVDPAVAAGLKDLGNIGHRDLKGTWSAS